MFGNELWVKTGEGNLVLEVKGVEQISHGLLGKFQSVGVANSLEDFLEFVHRRWIDLHLIVDAPQLRGVHELLRRKVRSEYYQLIEQ